MISKETDVVLGWGLLGTIALPALTVWLQQPFIPDTPQVVLLTSDLFYAWVILFAGATGMILGVATGLTILRQRQRNWRAASAICLTGGGLIMLWEAYFIWPVWSAPPASWNPAWLFRAHCVEVLLPSLWGAILVVWGFCQMNKNRLR